MTSASTTVATALVTVGDGIWAQKQSQMGTGYLCPRHSPSSSAPSQAQHRQDREKASIREGGRVRNTRNKDLEAVGRGAHEHRYTQQRSRERRQQRGQCILIPFTREGEIKGGRMDWKERKPAISQKHDHTQGCSKYTGGTDHRCVCVCVCMYCKNPLPIVLLRRDRLF